MAHQDNPVPDYAVAPSRPRIGWLFLKILVAVAVVAVFLFAVFLINEAKQGRRMMGRIECHQQLTRLGSALAAYTSLNAGRLPVSLNEVVSGGNVTPATLKCPGSGGRPYLYAGSSLVLNRLREDTVIAYEPLANHGNDGIHVLLANGHVDFLVGSEATRVFNQLQQGATVRAWSP